MHRLGLHSHPHVCVLRHPPVVIYIRRGCGTCRGPETQQIRQSQCGPASHEFVPIAVETLVLYSKTIPYQVKYETDLPEAWPYSQPLKPVSLNLVKLVKAYTS